MSTRLRAKASLIEPRSGSIWNFALTQTAAILLRKTAKLHANNAGRCSKAPKETPHRIKAPPLCATHLKKADENFNLLISLVRACRRAHPSVSNRPAALPEKDSLFQSFRRAFFKRPRTPLAYSPVSFSPTYFVSGEVKGALLSLNICAIVPSATRPSIMPLISSTSASLPNANANA